MRGMPDRSGKGGVIIRRIPFVALAAILLLVPLSRNLQAQSPEEPPTAQEAEEQDPQEQGEDSTQSQEKRRERQRRRREEALGQLPRGPRRASHPGRDRAPRRLRDPPTRVGQQLPGPGRRRPGGGTGVPAPGRHHRDLARPGNLPVPARGRSRAGGENGRRGQPAEGRRGAGHRPRQPGDPGVRRGRSGVPERERDREGRAAVRRPAQPSRDPHRGRGPELRGSAGPRRSG